MAGGSSARRAADRRAAHWLVPRGGHRARGGLSGLRIAASAHQPASPRHRANPRDERCHLRPLDPADVRRRGVRVRAPPAGDGDCRGTVSSRRRARSAHRARRGDWTVENRPVGGGAE